jgi:hypothetical protein
MYFIVLQITLDIKESRTDSKASGREPEIPFDKSTSGFSTDDTSTIGPSRPESSVEYLMTAQEIQVRKLCSIIMYLHM